MKGRGAAQRCIMTLSASVFVYIIHKYIFRRLVFLALRFTSVLARVTPPPVPAPDVTTLKTTPPIPSLKEEFLFYLYS